MVNQPQVILNQLTSIKHFKTAKDQFPQLLLKINNLLDLTLSSLPLDAQACRSSERSAQMKTLCQCCFVAADILRSDNQHTTASQILSKARAVADQNPLNIEGDLFVSLGMAKYSLETRQSLLCVRNAVRALALSLCSNDNLLISSCAFLVFGMKKFICDDAVVLTTAWIDLREELTHQYRHNNHTATNLVTPLDIDVHSKRITEVLVTYTQTDILEWALSLIKSLELQNQPQQELQPLHRKLDLHSTKVDISSALAEQYLSLIQTQHRDALSLSSKAIELLMENINACNICNDWFGKGNTLVSLASAHSDLHKSMELLKEAFECFASHDHRWVASMGNVQRQIGECYVKMAKLTESKLREQQQIEIDKENTNSKQYYQRSVAIASLWKEIFGYVCSAKIHFEKAISLFDECNRKHGKAATMRCLGLMMMWLADVVQACLSHFERCDGETSVRLSQCILDDLAQLEIDNGDSNDCVSQNALKEKDSILRRMRGSAVLNYKRCRECVETETKQGTRLFHRIESEIQNSQQ
eukprot:c10113_g3_i1.p1 GENE.c10113_g3_i1~~c10113_g3_i1.p1  ORF type:complete len:529 (-),score=115.03 c10113_g3_i1:351-1937(-)